MAHASSLEKVKLQMKKYRKVMLKKKEKENLIRADIGEELYGELIKIKNEKPIEEQVRTALWDYERGQYPRTKYHLLKDLINQRLKETQDKQEIQKLNTILNTITERK